MISLDNLEAKAKAAIESPTWHHGLFREAANPNTVLALIRIARAAQLAAKYAEVGDVPAPLLEALKEIAP